MVQDGEDLNDLKLHAVKHAVRKIGENGTSEAGLHRWIELGMCPDSADYAIDRRGEFAAKADAL